MKKIINIMAALVLGTCAMACVPAIQAEASKPTDEITDYEITADVNDDATVTMTYNISWKVLESDKLGPVSWVDIGVPNSHCTVTALTDNIDSAEFVSDSGYYAEIYFKDDYYEGETIDFAFQVTQDHLYQMNQDEDGYTVYSFTPGWFDEIDVDKLVIRWNCDKAESWSPSCSVDSGYLIWETSLSAGEEYTVDVTYPNDAYSFTEYTDDADDYYDDEDDPEGDFFAGVFLVALLIGLVSFFKWLSSAIGAAFDALSGFGTKDVKKTTRTRIEYYPSCPGCGAAREEGKDECQYCGRSLIKSKEVIKEEDIPEEEKSIRNQTTSGTYRYSTMPNTYLVVNTRTVHRPTYTRPSSGGSHTGSRSHSSCAHSSCACACACACAGGGRAGCTTKDFYNTKLKLKYLKKLNRT